MKLRKVHGSVSFVDEDNDTDLDWMTKKIINLRIFNDDEEDE